MVTRLQAIQGMDLPTLRRVIGRNRAHVDSACRHRVAYLKALGLVNSLLALCERRQYGETIAQAPIEQPPLFIIGHWRSGTTHLHNLLSLDTGFDSPRLYQAMFPLHFCFTQRKGRPIMDFLGPGRRPMDNVAVRSTSPYEDEFALVALTGISPYLRFWFPNAEDLGDAALDPRQLEPEKLAFWKRSFNYYLKKLCFWKDQKRIVLKSPPHTGRVATLLKLFPGAQFVHIVRNPFEVYLSMRKTWLKGISHSHLQRPDAAVIDELILSWYSELFSLFERDRPCIPEGDLCEIRYEDIVQRPVETLAQIYEQLSLPGFDPFRVHARDYLHGLGKYRRNELVLNCASREKVCRRWRSTFERYGYSMGMRE